MLKPIAEIRDPVHGYVKITEVERDLIDSPFIQRLRRIHQLAGAYLVYPGAVHSRFEHVIGTMNVAGVVAAALSKKNGIEKDGNQEGRIPPLPHQPGDRPLSPIY